MNLGPHLSLLIWVPILGNCLHGRFYCSTQSMSASTVEGGLMKVLFGISLEFTESGPNLGNL